MWNTPLDTCYPVLYDYFFISLRSSRSCKKLWLLWIDFIVYKVWNHVLYRCILVCIKTSVNPPNKNKSKPSKLSNLYIYVNWFPDNDILDKEVSVLGKEVTVLGERSINWGLKKLLPWCLFWLHFLELKKNELKTCSWLLLYLQMSCHLCRKMRDVMMPSLSPLVIPDIVFMAMLALWQFWLQCNNAGPLAWAVLTTKVNMYRPRQNIHHFAEDIFKFMFFNEKFEINWSLKKESSWVDNKLALIQIMVWHGLGKSDKQLSEPMMA